MWHVIEIIPNQHGTASQWREHLGADFEAFAQAFLARSEQRASSLLCARCGCLHEVVGDPATLSGECGSGAGIRVHAVCRCKPWRCEDLLLAPDDLRLYELSWTRLARKLCTAFGLEPRAAAFPWRRTLQVGAWSSAALPVLFTLQPDAEQFRSAVAEIVARLRRDFILLAPTLTHVDARALELLGGVGAACADLESATRFDRAGNLTASRQGAGFFARFAPQHATSEENIARKAMAVLQELEKNAPFTAPSVMQVFRLYCVEALSAAEVAERCQCSKTSVMRRLQCLRERTGFSADRLRHFSNHFANLEDSFADSRAEHIHRRSLIDDAEEQD